MNGFENDDSVLEHEYDEEESASSALIKAVCAIENVDPTEAPNELGFCLYDHIDPEALDSLVDESSTSESVEIDFGLDGYCVRVSSTGRIILRETDS